MTTSSSAASLTLPQLLEFVQREALTHALDMLRSIVAVKEKLQIIKTISSFKIARTAPPAKSPKPEKPAFNLAEYNAKLTAVVDQCESEVAAARPVTHRAGSLVASLAARAGLASHHAPMPQAPMPSAFSPDPPSLAPPRPSPLEHDAAS